MAYAQQRESFGKQIWKHQSVGNYLAESATKITAARQLILYAALMIVGEGTNEIQRNVIAAQLVKRGGLDRGGLKYPQRRRPMNIAVPIKQVPDTYSERTLRSADGILDRSPTDPVLDEINERVVEAALQLKEAHGGEVTLVCMGPAPAADAIRKALSMGADQAVHLSDDALAGSDPVQTAGALAQVIAGIEGSGSIVNISSLSGKVGNPGQMNYSAAKAGLVGLTKGLAKELGPSGVRVNAVQPGLIRTAMTLAMKPEIYAAKEAEVPMGRAGCPRRWPGR